MVYHTRFSISDILLPLLHVLCHVFIVSLVSFVLQLYLFEVGVPVFEALDDLGISLLLDVNECVHLIAQFVVAFDLFAHLRVRDVFAEDLLELLFQLLILACLFLKLLLLRFPLLLGFCFVQFDKVFWFFLFDGRGLVVLFVAVLN